MAGRGYILPHRAAGNTLPSTEAAPRHDILANFFHIFSPGNSNRFDPGPSNSSAQSLHIQCETLPECGAQAWGPQRFAIEQTQRLKQCRPNAETRRRPGQPRELGHFLGRTVAAHPDPDATPSRGTIPRASSATLRARFCPSTTTPEPRVFQKRESDETPSASFRGPPHATTPSEPLGHERDAARFRVDTPEVPV